MLSVKVDRIPILPIGDSVDQGPTYFMGWVNQNGLAKKYLQIEITLYEKLPRYEQGLNYISFS